MRIMRGSLTDAGKSQYFHVVSRVVDRRFIFQDAEKDIFLMMMRKLEGFSGVEVMAYCLMTNHFHLLLRVPIRPDEISEKEVLARMKKLYSKDQMDDYLTLINDMDETVRKVFLDRFRIRMYDLSHFVRELKLRFSKYYNSRMERKGTLWEERFKATLVEGRLNALMNTAAYIELNPVRAGIVEDPMKYRWCSYTEAVAGGRAAREGIVKLTSRMGNRISIKEALRIYREFFLECSVHQSGSRKGMDSEELHKIRSGGSQNLTAMYLKTKVRYFTDGLIIGSREFIEEFYLNKKDFLNPLRKKISSRFVDYPDDLHSFRNTRVR